MPGCSLTSGHPALVLRVYDVLRERFPGIGLTVQCCAKPSLTLGGDAFSQFSSSLEREFAKHGIHTVVTACPNCLKTIRRFRTAAQSDPTSEMSNDVGMGIKTLSLYEVLAWEGVPGPDLRGLRVALYDPCPVRDENGLHDAVRSLLAVRGAQIQEFATNRSHAVCCGSKNMALLRNREKALECMRQRVSQSPCEGITSYCQSCVDSMRLGGGTSCHVLELLFATADDIVTDSTTGFGLGRHVMNKHVMGSLARWFNRWKVARLVRRMPAQGEKQTVAARSAKT